jgi:hypothetical protein
MDLWKLPRLLHAVLDCRVRFRVGSAVRIKSAEPLCAGRAPSPSRGWTGALPSGGRRDLRWKTCPITAAAQWTSIWGEPNGEYHQP